MEITDYCGILISSICLLNKVFFWYLCATIFYSLIQNMKKPNIYLKATVHNSACVKQLQWLSQLKISLQDNNSISLLGWTIWSQAVTSNLTVLWDCDSCLVDSVFKRFFWFCFCFAFHSQTMPDSDGQNLVFDFWKTNEENVSLYKPGKCHNMKLCSQLSL